jgi:hypothetical protein
VKTTLLAFIACAVTAGVYAQERFFDQFRTRRPELSAYTSGNQPYDGRFVFVRLRYEMALGGGGFRRGRELPWAHDYPTADVHMMKIMKELTFLDPRIDGSNVLTLDDPELFSYPVAYMSEPGFWNPSDAEAEGLRKYLLKGGFLIFDDFRGYDWENLEAQMRRALPDHRFIQLDVSHPIFHSFFEIDSLEFLTSYNGQPTYYGIFEGNDPRKRLMVIANRDNDLGEYWEYSDTGYAPVDLSNEAYKFGVNYMMYALMH